MRLTTRTYTSNILPFFDLCYATHSDIHYRHDFSVKSKRGYQQGDGLASFGFGLALYHRFKDNPELLELILNIWYHDDGILRGTPCEVGKALAIIADFGPKIGLNLRIFR